MKKIYNIKLKSYQLLISSFIILFGLGLLSCANQEENAGGKKKKVFKKSTWEAPLQKKALEFDKKINPITVEVFKESHYKRKLRLQKMFKELSKKAPDYFYLNSPIMNRVTKSKAKGSKGSRAKDYFSPVRFNHRMHIGVTKDCTVCHHYKSADNKDGEIERCSNCHQEPFNKKVPGRLGLKAAYHTQCIGCHKEKNKGPVGCVGCHEKNVPNHEDLVKLNGNETPQQITEQCISCHKKEATDVLHSAHWRWEGPSVYTVAHKHQHKFGKRNVINNFCIATTSNEPRCTSCHVGYGWKDSKFDFTNKSNIDCLVCHDQTGTYKKAGPKAGMPAKNVDLTYVAKHVGKASRKNCGDCHFYGGGGDGVKHGELNSSLMKPDVSCDVHMGGYNFQCTECHQAKNHLILGRSSSVPATEGAKSCEDCHTSKPHQGNTILDRHLNQHTDHMACNTCHTPLLSKCKPTKVFWDWSKAGDKKRKPKKDKYGKPDYMWKKGEFKWNKAFKPEYAWYDGYTNRILPGDTFDLNKVVHISIPQGNIEDPNSKIYPFKVMRGVQPADPVNKYFIIPHLFGKGGYWKDVNWEKAFVDGMKAAKLKYSGKHVWVKTDMYWRAEHEVVPAKMALSCEQCHSSLKSKAGCSKCHNNAKLANKYQITLLKIRKYKYKHFKGNKAKSFINQTNYLDFKKLGYKGDPIEYGGRFKEYK